MESTQSEGGPTLTQRLRQIRDALTQDLIERDVPIRLALLAALTGEHLLLVGPPGTAKSLLARRLRLAFTDTTYFERLLTRFTVPEELFGPLSIKALENDRYHRLTESYLPRACVAFLDEIFKANSAILNSLLTLLNEREFDNGAVREKTPLLAVIGASNELPEGDELSALFDRFLLRLHVGPVSDEGFKQLLSLSSATDGRLVVRHALTRGELADIRDSASLVGVGADVVALLMAMRHWCGEQQIAVSDRRWRKVVRLLQMSAWTNGRDDVSLWDCWLLQYCLWERPEQRERIHEWYSSRVGASHQGEPSRMTTVVVAWENKLKKDKESRSQCQNAEGDLLYTGPNGEPTTDTKTSVQRRRGGRLLYLAPSYNRDDRSNQGNGFTEEDLNGLVVGNYREYFGNWSGRAAYLKDPGNWLMDNAHDLPPLTQLTLHKPEYVTETLRKLAEYRAQCEEQRQFLSSQQESVESEIRQHLWVSSDFAAPAARALAVATAEVEQLIQRLDRTITGFRSLPQEGAVAPSGTAPATPMAQATAATRKRKV